MKKINLMFSILMMLLILTFMEKDAKAQSLPSWCFQYTSQDGIEAEADQWWWWGNASFGTAIIGPSNSRHSGSGAIKISFSTSDSNGSFIVADRNFDYLTLLNTNLNKRSSNLACGRGNTQPLFPSTSMSLKFCSASIWVLPTASRGANGSFQLLSTDYTYLATADFNFPNSSSGIWQKVNIPSTTNCQNSMIVRVGIQKTSTSIAAVFDDLEINWNY